MRVPEMQAALRREGRGEGVRRPVAGPALVRKLATRLLDVVIGVRGRRTAEPGNGTMWSTVRWRNGKWNR